MKLIKQYDANGFGGLSLNRIKVFCDDQKFVEPKYVATIVRPVGFDDSMFEELVNGFMGVFESVHNRANRERTHAKGKDGL